MYQKNENRERINEMKQEYELYPVPEEALKRIRQGIAQAKRENGIAYGKEDGFMKRRNGADGRNRKRSRLYQLGKAAGLTAAAVMIVIVILANSNASIAMALERIPVIGAITKVVIFRDYKYDSERNHADIEVPEIVISNADNMSAGIPADLHENFEKSAEEINEEIKEITDGFLKDFEENLANEWGYQDIVVKSEVVSTTQDYFTLKLICYQGAGSGTEWNYYYTIDLKTGERLQLKDIFRDGADYITPISENIKVQMRQQMEGDESKYYWLDDEIEEWNFKQITDDTAFYLNENNNIVISFNEGDVAPMYMGVVTFEIPNDVVKEILK